MEATQDNDQETTDAVKCPLKKSRLDWEAELTVLIPKGNNLLDILAILMYWDNSLTKMGL